MESNTVLKYEAKLYTSCGVEMLDMKLHKEKSLERVVQVDDHVPEERNTWNIF